MKADGRPMLKLSHVDTHYGPIQILRDVNVEINAGEITCLLGGNASGKSTTLRTVIGMVRPSNGTIEFNGEQIDGLNTQQLVERGISMVPENRRIFGRMTVQENLEMGAFLRNDRSGIQEDMERVFGLFPRLKERTGQLGGTMSGGEQQMLAMARALMSRPSLLLMDEPSMGLSPLFVQQTFDIIQEISRQGTTIFVVEQNANMALSIADRGYVLQTGKIVLADTAANLRENKMMRQAYLGET
ncbi:MAG: ABC transporter ATP-binding protein [Anaerolineales bacterium]|jgi:branched-chain amino acid transport system ATP-binding protein|nr:ABC transporter ATP-binding protein [Anaerolineales bacterium]|tara:strand:- start:305 stop:1033 length:729 start_codon:yes stop_codon:yes gene_type:complete